MNLFGKTLAAVGAVILTVTAVALPEVCHVKAPTVGEADRVVTGVDAPHADYVAKFLAADRQ